jgi:hypothetical protein
MIEATGMCAIMPAQRCQERRTVFFTMLEINEENAFFDLQLTAPRQ